MIEYIFLGVLILAFVFMIWTHRKIYHFRKMMLHKPTETFLKTMFFLSDKKAADFRIVPHQDKDGFVAHSYDADGTEIGSIEFELKKVMKNDSK